MQGRQCVLVTGGAGFVGSHVVDAFLVRGCEVLVVDDLSSGDEGNVPTIAAHERLDIADGDALGMAVTRFRLAVVCHLAAQASVTVSVDDPGLAPVVYGHGHTHPRLRARARRGPGVRAPSYARRWPPGSCPSGAAGGVDVGLADTFRWYAGR